MQKKQKNAYLNFNFKSKLTIKKQFHERSGWFKKLKIKNIGKIDFGKFCKDLQKNANKKILIKISEIFQK